MIKITTSNRNQVIKKIRQIRVKTIDSLCEEILNKIKKSE